MDQVIQSIAGNYPDKKLFANLLCASETPAPAVPELVDQIDKSMPYRAGSTIRKPDKHLGQRKLLLSEVQFLEKSNSKYIVYAGSAPGNKTWFLSTLFPDKRFILVDPNKFDITVNNRSHRDDKHKDIVHLELGNPTYPTKANSVNISLDGMVDYISNSQYKIFLLETYMDDNLANVLKDLQADFISDIRSNIMNGRCPLDLDIAWNNCMMYNWIKIMRPAWSMVKIRMLFGTDPPLEIPSYILNDFNKHADGPTRFLEAYRKNITRMPRGELYLQCWSPLSSTEMRLYIKLESLDDIIEYDSATIENKFAYYNNIVRGWCYFPNDNSDPELRFCHCVDCALENLIWTKYTKQHGSTVKKLVAAADTVTKRPLHKHHLAMIWSPTTPSNMLKHSLVVSKAYSTCIQKSDRKKIKLNRGNVGRHVAGGSDTNPVPALAAW